MKMSCNHVDKELCICNDRELEILKIKKNILRELLIEENKLTVEEIDNRIQMMEIKARIKYSDA